jgi:hypothetical protein
MANLTKKKISEAKARLSRADAPTSSLFAASCSLASIIFACRLMIGVIQSQEDRIAELENLLRNQGER